MRPLRPAQTQINLRIRMSVDDITFTQTVLYDGKMSRGGGGGGGGYNITIPSNFAQLCIPHTLRGLASVVCRILRLLGLIPSVWGKSAKRRYLG